MMRLYLIKRKSDGKFFGGINGHYILQGGASHEDAQYWSHSPQMLLKTADGVAGNLRRLCSEAYYDTDAPKGVCAGLAAKWKELSWRNFNQEKMSDYEVVILDVDVLSMRATPATDFIQMEAVKMKPLTKRERQLAST